MRTSKTIRLKLTHNQYRALMLMLGLALELEDLPYKAECRSLVREIQDQSAWTIIHLGESNV